MWLVLLNSQIKGINNLLNGKYYSNTANSEVEGKYKVSVCTVL